MTFDEYTKMAFGTAPSDEDQQSISASEAPPEFSPNPEAGMTSVHPADTALEALMARSRVSQNEAARTAVDAMGAAEELIEKRSNDVGFIGNMGNFFKSGKLTYDLGMAAGEARQHGDNESAVAILGVKKSFEDQLSAIGPMEGGKLERAFYSAAEQAPFTVDGILAGTIAQGLNAAGAGIFARTRAGQALGKTVFQIAESAAPKWAEKFAEKAVEGSVKNAARRQAFNTFMSSLAKRGATYAASGAVENVVAGGAAVTGVGVAAIPAIKMAGEVAFGAMFLWDVAQLARTLMKGDETGGEMATVTPSGVVFEKGYRYATGQLFESAMKKGITPEQYDQAGNFPKMMAAVYAGIETASLITLGPGVGLANKAIAKFTTNRSLGMLANIGLKYAGNVGLESLEEGVQGGTEQVFLNKMISDAIKNNPGLAATVFANDLVDGQAPSLFKDVFKRTMQDTVESIPTMMIFGLAGVGGHGITAYREISTKANEEIVQGQIDELIRQAESVKGNAEALVKLDALRDSAGNIKSQEWSAAIFGAEFAPALEQARIVLEQKYDENTNYGAWSSEDRATYKALLSANIESIDGVIRDNPKMDSADLQMLMASKKELEDKLTDVTDREIRSSVIQYFKDNGSIQIGAKFVTGQIETDAQFKDKVNAINEWRVQNGLAEISLNDMKRAMGMTEHSLQEKAIKELTGDRMNEILNVRDKIAGSEFVSTADMKKLLELFPDGITMKDGTVITKQALREMESTPEELVKTISAYESEIRASAKLEEETKANEKKTADEKIVSDKVDAARNEFRQKFGTTGTMNVEQMYRIYGNGKIPEIKNLGFKTADEFVEHFVGKTALGEHKAKQQEKADSIFSLQGIKSKKVKEAELQKRLDEIVLSQGQDAADEFVRARFPGLFELDVPRSAKEIILAGTQANEAEVKLEQERQAKEASDLAAKTEQERTARKEEILADLVKRKGNEARINAAWAKVSLAERKEFFFGKKEVFANAAETGEIKDVVKKSGKQVNEDDIIGEEAAKRDGLKPQNISALADFYGGVTDEVIDYVEKVFGIDSAKDLAGVTTVQQLISRLGSGKNGMHRLRLEDGTLDPKSVEAIKAAEEAAKAELKEVFGSPTANERAEQEEKKQSGKKSIFSGTMAADYFLNGGSGSMISTEYLLQAYSGMFNRVSEKIEEIREKYKQEITDKGLDDISKFKESELYSKIMDEIKSVVTSSYNKAESENILTELLKHPTGTPVKTGTRIRKQLEALDNSVEAVTREESDVEASATSDQRIGNIVNSLSEVMNPAMAGEMARLDAMQDSTEIGEDAYPTQMEVEIKLGVKAVASIIINDSQGGHAFASIPRVFGQTEETKGESYEAFFDKDGNLVPGVEVYRGLLTWSPRTYTGEETKASEGSQRSIQVSVIERPGIDPFVFFAEIIGPDSVGKKLTRIGEDGKLSAPALGFMSRDKIIRYGSQDINKKLVRAYEGAIGPKAVQFDATMRGASLSASDVFGEIVTEEQADELIALHKAGQGVSEGEIQLAKTKLAELEQLRKSAAEKEVLIENAIKSKDAGYQSVVEADLAKIFQQIETLEESEGLFLMKAAIQKGSSEMAGSLLNADIEALYAEHGIFVGKDASQENIRKAIDVVEADILEVASQGDMETDQALQIQLGRKLFLLKELYGRSIESGTAEKTVADYIGSQMLRPVKADLMKQYYREFGGERQDAKSSRKDVSDLKAERDGYKKALTAAEKNLSAYTAETKGKKLRGGALSNAKLKYSVEVDGEVMAPGDAVKALKEKLASTENALKAVDLGSVTWDARDSFVRRIVSEAVAGKLTGKRATALYNFVLGKTDPETQRQAKKQIRDALSRMIREDLDGIGGRRVVEQTMKDLSTNQENRQDLAKEFRRALDPESFNPNATVSMDFMDVLLRLSDRYGYIRRDLSLHGAAVDLFNAYNAETDPTKAKDLYDRAQAASIVWEQTPAYKALDRILSVLDMTAEEGAYFASVLFESKASESASAKVEAAEYQNKLAEMELSRQPAGMEFLREMANRGAERYTQKSFWNIASIKSGEDGKIVYDISKEAIAALKKSVPEAGALLEKNPDAQLIFRIDAINSALAKTKLSGGKIVNRFTGDQRTQLRKDLAAYTKQLAGKDADVAALRGYIEQSINMGQQLAIEKRAFRSILHAASDPNGVFHSHINKNLGRIATETQEDADFRSEEEIELTGISNERKETPLGSSKNPNPRDAMMIAEELSNTKPGPYAEYLKGRLAVTRAYTDPRAKRTEAQATELSSAAAMLRKEITSGNKSPILKNLLKEVEETIAANTRNKGGFVRGTRFASAQEAAPKANELRRKFAENVIFKDQNRKENISRWVANEKGDITDESFSDEYIETARNDIEKAIKNIEKTKAYQKSDKTAVESRRNLGFAIRDINSIAAGFIVNKTTDGKSYWITERSGKIPQFQEYREKSQLTSAQFEAGVVKFVKNIRGATVKFENNVGTITLPSGAKIEITHRDGETITINGVGKAGMTDLTTGAITISGLGADSTTVPHELAEWAFQNILDAQERALIEKAYPGENPGHAWATAVETMDMSNHSPATRSVLAKMVNFFRKMLGMGLTSAEKLAREIDEARALSRAFISGALFQDTNAGKARTLISTAEDLNTLSDAVINARFSSMKAYYQKKGVTVKMEDTADRNRKIAFLESDTPIGQAAIRGVLSDKTGMAMIRAYGGVVGGYTSLKTILHHIASFDKTGRVQTLLSDFLDARQTKEADIQRRLLDIVSGHIKDDMTKKHTVMIGGKPTQLRADAILTLKAFITDADFVRHIDQNKVSLSVNTGLSREPALITITSSEIKKLPEIKGEKEFIASWIRMSREAASYVAPVFKEHARRGDMGITRGDTWNALPDGWAPLYWPLAEKVGEGESFGKDRGTMAMLHNRKEAPKGAQVLSVPLINDAMTGHVSAVAKFAGSSIETQKLRDVILGKDGIGEELSTALKEAGVSPVSVVQKIKSAFNDIEGSKPSDPAAKFVNAIFSRQDIMRLGRPATMMKMAASVLLAPLNLNRAGSLFSAMRSPAIPDFVDAEYQKNSFQVARKHATTHSWAGDSGSTITGRQVITGKRSLTEKMAMIPGMADQWTMKMIFMASAYDNLPEGMPMSVESLRKMRGDRNFWAGVREKANRITSETQPTSMPELRGGFYNSKDLVMRTLTRYGTQQNRMLNLLQESYFDAFVAKVPGGRQKFEKTVAYTVVMNAAIMSAIPAISTALSAIIKALMGNDDDEYKFGFEKGKTASGEAAKRFGEETVKNLVGLVEGGDEALTAVQALYGSTQGQKGEYMKDRALTGRFFASEFKMLLDTVTSLSKMSAAREKYEETEDDNTARAYASATGKLWRNVIDLSSFLSGVPFAGIRQVAPIEDAIRKSAFGDLTKTPSGLDTYSFGDYKN